LASNGRGGPLRRKTVALIKSMRRGKRRPIKEERAQSLSDERREKFAKIRERLKLPEFSLLEVSRAITVRGSKKQF